MSGEYRRAYGYLGIHSGRDGDKVKAAGSPPVFDDGTVYFAEAGLVLICRKICHAPLVEEGFADPSIVTWNYLKKDFHEVYVDEFLSSLKKQD